MTAPGEAGAFLQQVIDTIPAPVFFKDRRGAYRLCNQVGLELLAARQAAEAAARSAEDFLATLSHEIRTPLGAVIGMTDLLRATEFTEEQRELVALIDPA